MNNDKSLLEQRFAGEYEFTNNIAVDMISSAIVFYRNKEKKIKLINLREDYYDIFVEYIASKTELKGDEEFCFENIDIKRSIINGERMYCEFE